MKTRWLLLLGWLLLAAPVVVQAQINYAISGNTAYVTTSPYAAGYIGIASTYGGYPVTSIGDEAFENCNELDAITIPNSVTNIGDFAFFDCRRMVEIAVDSGNLFYSSASGVLFNKSQTTLIQAPSSIGGLYTIPESVTSIGDGAFAYCSRLYSLTIPNNVTNIGEDAFASTALTSVTIPDSVTSIGVQAFAECYGLTGVAIPNSVTSIGDGAFAHTGLTNVTIPDSVSSIGVQAFFECSSLTSVTIPNSVTSIGDDAFASTALTSVTIPDSVTSIGAYTFDDCTSLTNAYFQGNAPPDDGTVFSGDPATVYYLPGTTGWGPTFGSAPTAFWTLPYPLVLNNNPNFGVRNNQFGFTVSWATNLSIVVQACTNLASPVWTPIATNALAGGTNYFSDPQWANYPARFYRISSP